MLCREWGLLGPNIANITSAACANVDQSVLHKHKVFFIGFSFSTD